MLDRLRHKLLGDWAHVISRRPWWVLILALGGAAACVGYAAWRMGFESDRNALISENLDWNQRFIRWREDFPGNNDLYILVDTAPGNAPTPAPGSEREKTSEGSGGSGGSASGGGGGGTSGGGGRARAEALVDALGKRLVAHPLVEAAVWGYRTDPQSLHPRSVRLLGMEAFGEQLDRMRQAQPLLASATPGAMLDRIAAQASGNSGGFGSSGGSGGAGEAEAQAAMGGERVAAGLAGFTKLIDAFTHRLQTPAERPVDLMRVIDEEAAGGWRYLATENGRLLTIRVTPRASEGSMTPYEDAIKAIRAVMKEVGAEFPGVEFGLTGIEVVEADETATTTRDSTIASILAAVLISLLLIFAFHSFRTPLMLLVSLAIGIAWTFGFLTLVVGYLQVISIVFTVILLGLGAAFGIHIVSRFELIRHRYADDSEGFALALQNTLEVMGPGILTGAVTTAAAFCTTMLTDFRGVAEMGLIAAGGVMLCLVAMVSVFPALLRLHKSRHEDVVRMEDWYVHFFEESWVRPFTRRPRVTIAVAMVVGVASLIVAGRVEFDYNLINLLPRGVDSVVWQQRAVRDGEQSVYYATSIVDDMDEARRMAELFRTLPTVESLGGVGRLFPPDEQEKIALLEEVRRALEPALSEALGVAEQAEAQASNPGAHPEEGPGKDPGAGAYPGAGESILQKLVGLRLALTLGRGRLPVEAHDELNALIAAMNRYAQAQATLDPQTLQRRLDALQRDYTAWRQTTARYLDMTLDTSPLQLTDLPADVMYAYIGRDAQGRQKLAIDIYPKLPPGVEEPLEPKFLQNYISQLYSVDPAITGVIVQVYESGTLIWRSYLLAGGYALVAVLALLLVDLRSLRDALLCLAPVALGFALTFAVLVLTGIGINPANIIVLPLMFGIGVDAGVHVIHRYRHDPTQRPLGLTHGTGKGISLTSYTTIIGFGSLMIASHRGIATLGLTLALGIAITLLACWTLMPAWLELRARRAGK